MKFIKYSYLKDHKLLIKVCKGEVVRRELISEFQQAFANINSDQPICILLDARKVKIKASVDESKLYTNFFLNKNIYKTVDQVAVVTDTPDQVVQTMMFIEGVKHLNKSIKIFSSTDSAINWLNTKASKETINKTLDSLNQINQHRKAS